MLELDRLSSAVIGSTLLYVHEYPIADVELKTDYSVERFKQLYEKTRPGEKIKLDRDELKLVIKGLDLLIQELSDNDFHNLIQVNKNHAINLTGFLKYASSNPNLISITTDLWYLFPSDELTYRVINSALHQASVFPLTLKKFKRKIGYPQEEFKALCQKLYEKYSTRNDFKVNGEDLGIIFKALNLLLLTLDDNTLSNLLQINKNQARKLLNLIADAGYDPRITLITSDLWRNEERP